MSEYCRDDFGLVEQADDDFKMWQGLVGPHYTPSVSEDGTLSWSNDGKLPNPEDVSIKGPPGEPGPPGAPGPGVPTGGTTGQILAKASDEDYDGEWIDPPEMDAGQVSYDSTEAYDDGTVGKELTTINSALSSLSSVTEIIDTVSGAIASFPDGSGLPMRSLLAQIEPQQDLHGYDAPWAGGAGKNLFDQDTCTTGKYIAEGGNIADWTTAEYSDYIAVTAGQQYIFSGTNKTGVQSTTRIHGYNSSKAWVQQITTESVAADAKWNTTFTAPEGISFVRVSTGYPLPDGQLEKGSTATAYQPYSNECPISGWTGLNGQRAGKNLLDESSIISGYTLTPDGLPTAESPRRLATGTPISVKGDNVTVSYTTTVNTVLFMYSLFKGNTLIERVANKANGSTIALKGADKMYLSWYDSQSSDITSGVVSKCMVSVGSTASTYEAYTSLPITCTWQTEAGTVYGGTVDVVSGVLTADRAKLVLDENIPSGSNGFRNISVLTNGVRAEYYPYRAVGRANSVVLSDKFRYGSVSDGTPFIVGTSETNQRLYLNLPLEYDTEEKIRAWFASNPSEFVCYLATPQTYQLTPQQISTLLGNNTVFVDCGSVSVTYQASIKGYIDKVLAS